MFPDADGGGINGQDYFGYVVSPSAATASALELLHALSADEAAFRAFMDENPGWPYVQPPTFLGGIDEIFVTEEIIIQAASRSSAETNNPYAEAFGLFYFGLQTYGGSQHNDFIYNDSLSWDFTSNIDEMIVAIQSANGQSEGPVAYAGVSGTPNLGAANVQGDFVTTADGRNFFVVSVASLNVSGLDLMAGTSSDVGGQFSGASAFGDFVGQVTIVTADGSVVNASQRTIRVAGAPVQMNSSFGVSYGWEVPPIDFAPVYVAPPNLTGIAPPTFGVVWNWQRWVDLFWGRE